MTLERTIKDIFVNDFQNNIRVTQPDGIIKSYGFDGFMDLLMSKNLGLFYSEQAKSYQFLLFRARTTEYLM